MTSYDLLYAFVRSYMNADKLFKSALEKVQLVSEGVITEKWEPLLNNLGHTARKLKSVSVLKASVLTVDILQGLVAQRHVSFKSHDLK